MLYQFFIALLFIHKDNDIEKSECFARYLNYLRLSEYEIL